jgi:hypothetical protein
MMLFITLITMALSFLASAIPTQPEGSQDMYATEC